MAYPTTLLMSGFVTHDTRRFVLERPRDFSFQPGQGIELTIDRGRWRGHAHLLFSNWLNYYVYQTTPYDLRQIPEGGTYAYF